MIVAYFFNNHKAAEPHVIVISLMKEKVLQDKYAKKRKRMK